MMNNDDMDLRYIWENGHAVQENPPKGDQYGE